MPVEGVAQVVRDLPTFDDPDLIVGVQGSSDAGVYRLADDLFIVQSLDFFPPLVNDPFTFGQIAAANSLSDIFAMGARPKTALNIVGFPDDQLDLSILGEILRGGGEKVKEAGAVIAGGHSMRDVEIKYGLSVTGVVHPDRLLTNSRAKPGDTLVLTKALGTGFVTTAHKAGRCDDEVMDAAIASMVQLNLPGRNAAEAGRARASTDITGFGLAVHAAEMAQASKVTVIINTHQLPCLPGAEPLIVKGNRTRASETNRKFAETLMRIEGQPDETALELAFDAQTSGGLLISVSSDQADAVVQRARQEGAGATCIVGEVVEAEQQALVLK